MNRPEMSKLFGDLAKSYDKANLFFSFGVDLYWRNRLINQIPKINNVRHLDIACGTGSIIKKVAERKNGEYFGIDISTRMLEVAKSKVHGPHVNFSTEDGQNLTFSDNSFDIVTNAFGIRNFPDFKKGLQESYRVLRPGGNVFYLEFQMPPSKILRKLYRFYLHKIMPRLGNLLSKDRSGWIYLGASIEYFSSNIDFEEELKEVGFVNIKRTPMTFGVATIFQGKKQ